MISDLDINTEAARGPIGPTRNDAHRSYIARHWHGDLRLTRSFWINWLLSTLAIFIVFFCAGVLIEIDNGPVLFALAISAAWLFAVASNVWYLVGVWRSSANHAGLGR
jgi:hypothetical protein